MASAAMPASSPPTPSGRVAAVAAQFEDRHRDLEARRDDRAVCVLAFRMMYDELAAQLHGNAFDFDDPSWVADLAVHFADLLFEAFDAIDAALAQDPVAPDFATVPPPWADVYRATLDPRSSVLEDLVCGLCAHIGHDLPIALSQVGLSSKGTSRVRDFHRLNEVLASLVDAVQGAVSKRYNRYLGTLDRLAGGADETLTNLGMRLFRASAWYTASRLLDPPSADDARAEIDGVTARAITMIRYPRLVRYRIASWCARTVLRGRRRWPEPTIRETA